MIQDTRLNNVLNTVVISGDDVCYSAEMHHARVVRLLKPPSICFNAYYLQISALWMTLKSYKKMPENVLTNGRMRFDDTKKKKQMISFRHIK